MRDQAKPNLKFIVVLHYGGGGGGGDFLSVLFMSSKVLIIIISSQYYLNINCSYRLNHFVSNTERIAIEEILTILYNIA